MGGGAELGSKNNDETISGELTFFEMSTREHSACQTVSKGPTDRRQEIWSHCANFKNQIFDLGNGIDGEQSGNTWKAPPAQP